MYAPTINIDEADTVLVDNEPLRAVINSGWTRGSAVVRCVGDSNTPHPFPTFAPKVIGSKGLRFPDTTLSRSIIIKINRKKRSEKVEHFDALDDAELADLRRQLLRYAMDNGEALKNAQRQAQMPLGFENRLGDNWRLLLAIADLASGEWPDLAREAAAALSKVDKVASIGTRLLTDIWAIFKEKNVDRFFSSTLVEALAALEDHPWAEWKNCKSLTKSQLAKLLGNYDIVSGTIRIGSSTAKGYQLAQFKDAFETYALQSPSDGDDGEASGADGQDALSLDGGEETTAQKRGRFRKVAEAPPDTHCVHCHNPEGKVFWIRDAHAGPGSKAEPLHEHCAPKYFR
jgi:hypothetical protein